MRPFDFDRLLDRNLVPAGIMFSRAGWKAAGGYPEAMRFGRQDWGFAVAMGQAGYCGVHVPEPLYLYRREGQNRTLRNSDAQWRETFVQQIPRPIPWPITRRTTDGMLWRAAPATAAAGPAAASDRTIGGDEDASAAGHDHG